MEYLLVLRQRGTAVSNTLKYYKCFAKLCLFQSTLFGSIEQGTPSVALLSPASIVALLSAEPISLLRLVFLISNLNPRKIDKIQGIVLFCCCCPFIFPCIFPVS